MEIDKYLTEINHIKEEKEKLFTISNDESKNVVEKDREGFVKFAMSHINKIENVELWDEKFWSAIYDKHKNVKRSPIVLLKKMGKEFVENTSAFIFNLLLLVFLFPMFISVVFSMEYSTAYNLWNLPLGGFLVCLNFVYYFLRLMTSVLSIAGNFYSLDKLVNKNFESPNVKEVLTTYFLAKKGVVANNFLMVPGEPIKFN